jgi:hypothetical protein
MQSFLFGATFAFFLLNLRQVNGQWYKDYKSDKPPSYLQPPWASAPGFADAPLPVAPKPMAPPPPPPQGFQGAGRFYPPPPPPPPSPPPPLPPPPPAPAVNFPSYAAGTNTSPHLVAQSSFLQLNQQYIRPSFIQLRGDGKGMMSFQYYDATNPPPWLQPPWNVQQPIPPQPQEGSVIPPPSFTQGSAPPGAAPILSTPLAYNPATLRQLPYHRLR